MSVAPDVRSALETHLGAPVQGTAFDILSTHLASLPPGLARAVGSTIPARDRTRIPAIRRRRTLHANAHAPPTASTSDPSVTAPAARLPLLSAEEGRRRWPLLWERLGGDPRVLTATAAQRDEESWAEQGFMPGRERFVGRLGQRLAEEEEMREWEDARTARARERLLDDVGEEFEDSDDEEEGGQQGGGTGIARAVAVAGNGIGRPSQSTGREDQAPVVEAFERRLLELFLDGLDTVDYDDFDFSEPPHDPIRERDEEGAWFDDEAPSSTSVLAPVTATASTSTAAGSGSVTVAPASPNGHSREHSHPTLNGVSASAANGTNGTSVNGTRFTTQNGQGEYDY